MLQCELLNDAKPRRRVSWQMPQNGDKQGVQHRVKQLMSKNCDGLHPGPATTLERTFFRDEQRVEKRVE